MTEVQKEQVELASSAMSPQLYYEYETRFIRQKLERDRVRLLPHVVVPEMFAHGGHALGDVRVFERFTAGPVSAMTCRFLELRGGESTPRERRIPTLLAYVLDGNGTVTVGEQTHAFAAGDAIVVPPYTEYAVTAGDTGVRAFVPENRLWHVLGLLWHEHVEPHRMPGEVELETGEDGEWSGYRFPAGMLGLDADTRVPAGPDPRRDAVFAARRAVHDVRAGDTQYDHFLRLLAEENATEEAQPRVIREADVPLEDTRQGLLKYYITNWTRMTGRDMELAVYEIPPGARTGRHRHIPEELLYVVEGSGHDVHDGTRQEWHAGDLICLPPMTEHQHVNDGEQPARLVSVWLNHPAHEFLGGIEHIEDASTWAQS